VSAAQALAAAHPEANLRIAADYAGLVASLERPRRIVLMVRGGAGRRRCSTRSSRCSSRTTSSSTRATACIRTPIAGRRAGAGKPWRFVGMGVSGGSDGALLGPSIMPGGDPEAWERLRPTLEAIAARSESGVCVAHCGRGSAGHFVKMVHNGIEYGDMQLIAETTMLLRDGLGLDAGAGRPTCTRAGTRATCAAS
jgi:6-phosphogluconate dehydrogenase